jgi:hypothetical protein
MKNLKTNITDERRYSMAEAFKILFEVGESSDEI